MKQFARTIAALVAVLTLAAFSASCANNGKGDVTTPAVAETTAGITEEPEETGLIPPDFTLNDETMGVLYWSDVENPEFFIEDTGNPGDKISDSINRRNQLVEQTLHVKLDFIGREGRNSKLKDFVSYIDSSYKAGDHAFDIIAGYSQTVANAAYNNYCYDLATTQYLSLESSWWPSLLTKEATVNGKLFFVSGDISTNMLYMMYTVFFNKNLLDTKSDLKSPYDMVAANEWTVDNMLAMSSDFYSDLDSDGKKSDADQYGIALPKLSLDAFFYGSGLRTTDRGDDGLIAVSDTYFSEKSESLLQKLEKFFYDTDDGLWKGGNEIFAAGRAAFYCDRAVSAIKYLGDADFEFGVVPAPKWSADQEAYYTCAGNPFTLYAIIGNSQRADEVSAVLDQWAYRAYKITTPAIFETTMKIRYAKDSETARMYDIIRDGVTFDLGRIYGITLEDMTQTLYRNAMDERSSWMRTKALRTKLLTKLLEGVNAAYTK